MKSLGREVFTFMCACIVISALFDCGGDSGSGAVRIDTASTGGTGAITGDTPCLRACANFARFCGDPLCSAVCAGVEAVYDEPLCASEAKAQFDCIATLPASDFDCGVDAGDLVEPAVAALMSGGRTHTCDAAFSAYGQCRRTHGADCAPEPTFDESCAVTDDVHTHFEFCKVDVAMPANCVPYTSAAALSGWYCCE